MASQGTSNGKGYLYLDRIDIRSSLKSSYRVELELDGDEVELNKDKEAPTWTPSRRLEVPASSKLTVLIKKGHSVAGISLGKEKTTVEIDSKDAFEQFWASKEAEMSISEAATFHQLPVTVTLKFVPSPTSGSVRAALQKLQEKMKEYSPLMGGSTQKNIDGALKIGAIFANANPFASAAFSVASVLFELLKEQQQYDEMVSDLTDEIGRVLPLADKVLDDAVREDTEQLAKVIRGMYSLTMDAAEFLCTYVQQSAYLRAAKSIVYSKNQEKIGGFKGEFSKLIQDFNQAVNVEALRGIRLVEEKLLLDRLEPAKTGYSLDRCCMEGTREALLNSIVEWAVNPRTEEQKSNATNIYWLYGIPGIGKTSVSHSICARLHEKGRLGGSFFCRRDDPNLGDSKCVPPTLIFKLAESWGPFRRVVAEKLRKDPHLTRNSAGYELLPQLLDTLENHPPDPLVIVIDALDECGDSQTRSSILSGLFHATSRVEWLRIIITSRQEQDIASSFDRILGAGHYAPKDLAADDKAQQDIQIFMQAKLSSVASKRYLPSDWPGTETMDKIIVKSGGLFIFVETLWRLIKDDIDPDKRLNQALSDTSGDALTSLYGLYSSIIETRIGQNKEAFRIAMGTIIAVGRYRPLRDESVAQLAGLGPHVIKAIVDELSSLLYRDATENDGIRVRHLSVIDFLTGPRCASGYEVRMGQANTTVGISCVKQMTQGPKFNICDLETSLRANEDVPSLNERVNQKIPDVLQYSCVHWSSHVCYDADNENSEVYGALDEFVKDSRLLYWIEALSLMSKVPAGVLALRQISSWSKSSQAPFLRKSRDALRFLNAFRTPIITGAPHVYLSGLPFSPIESETWKDASATFTNLMKVTQGRMKSWPSYPDAWTGHTDTVFCVAYSPDGRYIVSGSLDFTARIWDADTGAPVGEPLAGHLLYVKSVAYSPDGRRIASGSEDGTIRIWDAETGSPIGNPFEGHEGSILSIAYSPDGRYIVSGAADKTIMVWDAESGLPVGEPMKRHSGAIKGVVYSPDGLHIASASADKTLRIWDATTRAPIESPLEGHTGALHNLAYSPDGRHLASCSSDKTIRIWDAVARSPVGEPLKGHDTHVYSIAYSPDGRRIVSASSDETLRIWDVETCAPIGQPLKGHSEGVRGVAWSPNGQQIASGSEDKTVRIWDTVTGSGIGEPLKAHTGYVYSVACSPDGKRIASCSRDQTVRVWDSETGAPIGDALKGHTSWVFDVAYSPDGRSIVSCSEDATLRFWDAETCSAIGEPLKGHTNEVMSVAYSPDGQYVVSGSKDETLRIWDAKTKVSIGEPLKGHTNQVSSVAFSPDGKFIASGSWDATIRIWDAATGVATAEFKKEKSFSINTVSYSPDGHYLMSSSDDGAVRIWDIETKSLVREIVIGHLVPVISATYSADGRHIITTSTDSTIQIWNMETGSSVGEPLKGHENHVCKVKCSPDGSYIVSGSMDETIRIWRTKHNGTEDPATVQSVLSSPYDNTIQISKTGSTGASISVDLHTDPSGWVYHPDGGLLFWIPEDCRHGLICPATLTIPTMGRHRVVRLDAGEFHFGTSWISIKNKSP
ncbi:WD40 repeat-like protein [Serendipita vermifera]|nr:WD40 repeat-like protein [Serendipita vermifera]